MAAVVTSADAVAAGASHVFTAEAALTTNKLACSRLSILGLLIDVVAAASIRPAEAPLCLARMVSIISSSSHVPGHAASGLTQCGALKSRAPAQAYAGEASGRQVPCAFGLNAFDYLSGHRPLCDASYGHRPAVITC